MPLNVLYVTEKIRCLFNATQCPVFQGKTKINASVSFDAIN